MDAVEIARRVRAARAYAGISQNELADRIGASRSSVARFEDGDDDANVPDAGRRVAIATACELPGWFDESGTAPLLLPSDRLAQLDRIEGFVSEIPDGMEILRTLATPGILDKALAVLREVQEQDQQTDGARRPPRAN